MLERGRGARCYDDPDHGRLVSAAVAISGRLRLIGGQTMIRTVSGTFRNGAVQLAEVPIGIKESRVLVTFLDDGSLTLPERGIDAAMAAELRTALACFADEWDSPEMAIYDDYEAAKRKR